MQLRTRLTVQFVFTVAPIVLLGFTLIYFSSSDYRADEFNSRLKKKAVTIAELFIRVDEVDSLLLKRINQAQKDQLYNENISIYNSTFTEVFTNNDLIFFAPDTSMLREVMNNKQEFSFTEGETEMIAIPYTYRKVTYAVVAGAVDRFGHSKLRNLKNTLIVLFVVIVVIIGLSGWVYAARALKPIASVIDEAEKISPQNLSARLEIPSNKDELYRLVSTFNQLLDRIEQAFNLQKLFVASASHELKNPLTVITSQLEVSLINERSKEEYTQLIQSVLEDIRDLNRLTIQLMELARVSYQTNDILFSTIRADELLWNVRASLLARYPHYKVEYHIENLPEDEKQLCVTGNEALLKSAFANLAENGCKFSTSNEVKITLGFLDGKVNVTFSDKGPGISAEDLKYIFEPFYRTSRFAHVKGHGIGLALVQQVMRLHHGSLDVDSDEQGTRIFISLPTTSN